MLGSHYYKLIYNNLEPEEMKKPIDMCYVSGEKYIFYYPENKKFICLYSELGYPNIAACLLEQLYREWDIDISVNRLEEIILFADPYKRSKFRVKYLGLLEVIKDATNKKS
jgi:hypothetical protein